MPSQNKSQSTRCYCDVMETVSHEIHRRFGNEAERGEVLDILAEALREAKAPFACGAWLPDKVGGVPINCGIAADFVIANQVAVLVDTEGRSVENLESDARQCLRRGPFLEALIIRFGKHFLCRHITPREPGAKRATPPGPLVCV